jgi:amino acid adenylation domain-containing protein
MFTHQQFEAQVKDTPDNVAVVFEGESLSYRELDGRANQLARRLRSLGVAPEVPVGICMERSAELVIAVLGLLKSGGVYVPLDPSNPKERLSFIAKETRPKVLLAQQRLLECLPELDAKSICLDTDWSAVTVESTDPVENLTHSENLGFLIYTSGSTGEPKAVMLPQRRRDSRVSHDQKIYQMTESDRHVLKASISFTLILREIFWPLLTGARLIVSPPGTEKNINYLLDLIAKHHISIITLTPSLLRAILSEPGLERCRSLRHVVCFGEPLTAELQAQYFNKLSAELSLYYGATEAPSAAYRKCRGDNVRNVTELGHPLPGVQLHLLNDSLEPVADGDRGEIYLGGKLSRGYFGHPDLTAEKFIPNPLSHEPSALLYKTGDLGRRLPGGSIEFAGRVDDLIKVRGFRVELEEIAKAIRGFSTVKDACVIALDAESESSRIVAYVVPDLQSTFSASELRSYVQKILPEYMMPVRFIVLDTLPVSANGKIDRKALPLPERSRPELATAFAAARTSVEQDLVQIWSEVLDLDRIGIHDNFLDLGGNSLSATRILSRVIEKFRIDTRPQALFEAPTIAEMATAISQWHDRKPSENELKEILDEIESLGEEETRLLASKISTKSARNRS